MRQTERAAGAEDRGGKLIMEDQDQDQVEDQDEDQDEDGWFFHSLKKYEDLHMYQLEGQTPVLEWTSPQSVCVAGRHGNTSQILELQLPLKLLMEENKGLCSQRDFRVTCGVFTDSQVSGLKHVSGTRCVVTCGGRSSDLQLWDLSEDAGGVIRRTGSVGGAGGDPGGGGVKMAVRPSQPDLVHGARSGAISVTRLTTGATLSRHAVAAPALASLHFVSQDVFVASCGDGSVHLVDTRASSPPHVQAGPAGDPEVWWSDVSAGPDVSGCRLVQVSGSGLTLVRDLRSPARQRQARLDLRAEPSAPVQVSWAPALDHTFSVSGFGGNVLIYDASVWGAEPQQVPPHFEHRGHMVSAANSVTVAAHVWHHQRPRTLLSAASDGSAHLWDWIDQSGVE